MSILISKSFDNDFKTYFEELNHALSVNTALDTHLNFLRKNEKTYTEGLERNIPNIIKVLGIMNHSYETAYTTVCDYFTSNDFEGDVDKLTTYVLTAYFITQQPDDVKHLITFTRDLHKEIAAIKYGVAVPKVTNEMLEETKKAETPDNYSVEGESVDGWDRYFYNIAKQVALNSKCHSRKIGAVLARGKRIISTGYNGPPRGISPCDKRWKVDPWLAENHNIDPETADIEGKCPRRVIGFKSGEGLDVCVAGHAERNALINAAVLGVSTKDTTMYMTCSFPCAPCMVEIINAEVSEIVLASSARIYDKSCEYLLKNSDVKVRLFDFL